MELQFSSMGKAALDGGSSGDSKSTDKVAAGAHLDRATSTFLNLSKTVLIYVELLNERNHFHSSDKLSLLFCDSSTPVHSL